MSNTEAVEEIVTDLAYPSIMCIICGK